MNNLDFIGKHGKAVSVAKHDYVFMQGDDDENLYAVRSGLLKAYYVSPEGKETIKSFLRPGGMIASLTAAHKKVACTFNLLALEDSQLVKVAFSDLYEAANQTHAIALEMRDFLLVLSMKKEQREYEFLNLSAEERYQKFAHENPELIDQLTQNDIARYLGVTPVALSRIKKRLR